MGSAFWKPITRSLLLWTAIGALAVGLGCAGSSELEEGEGGYSSGSSGSSPYGENVAGSEFERYGGAAGSELSPEERAALGLQTVYFDYDQFSLSGEARETLRRNAEILHSHSDILVEIQGNCDERGSEEYNLALGERRARSAKDYLVDSGIPRGRISTVSFGESNPAAMGQSDGAWQLNRRDDFVPKR